MNAYFVEICNYMQIGSKCADSIDNVIPLTTEIFLWHLSFWTTVFGNSFSVGILVF